MASGGGDVVAITRVIAAQRPIRALNDALGALNDPIERRPQHLIERMVEGGAARGLDRRRRSIGLHRTAESGEATVGAGYDFAVENHFAAIVGAAERVLTA